MLLLAIAITIAIAITTGVAIGDGVCGCAGAWERVRTGRQHPTRDFRPERRRRQLQATRQGAKNHTLPKPPIPHCSHRALRVTTTHVLARFALLCSALLWLGCSGERVSGKADI
ncbi:hypothetical protein L1887_61686 [Cichorium endivia]|nr:hypothetical protein L1887_61686 [Cichorium endivia]